MIIIDYCCWLIIFVRSNYYLLFLFDMIIIVRVLLLCGVYELCMRAIERLYLCAREREHGLCLCA